MSQFQLSPCTPADVPSIIDLYLRAFTPSFTTYVFHPSHPTSAPASVRNWLAGRFTKQLTRSGPEMKFFKIVDAESGRMAAVGRFGFPYALSAEERTRREEAEREEREERERRGEVDYPEGANVGAYRWLFEIMDEMREKHMKWDQDYICYLLITDPDFQRRGLGRQLLGHVTAIADSENRRVYLEATAPGKPLYEKIGFQDIDLITLDMKRWGSDETDEFTVMIRDPHAETVARDDRAASAVS